MPTVLVIYATTHGHTAKIASRLARDLRACGLTTTCRNMTRDAAAASDYDAVVVIASLHAGHRQRSIAAWVRSNRDELRKRPSAFLSVSSTAADTAPPAQAAARRCLADFLEETEWSPDLTTTVAGALQYPSYGRLLRALMRHKMKRDGRPTDTTRLHEYTDWQAVAEFAGALASVVPDGPLMIPRLISRRQRLSGIPPSLADANGDLVQHPEP